MKAATLGDIIRYFNHQKPLTPADKKEWESFFIETRRKEISLIKAEFLKSTAGHKVLFGGHAGNGKSTELNKFIHEPQITDRFSIIKLDIQEMLNPYDIEIVELLLAICFQILTFAEENNLSIGKYIKDRFQKLESFFHVELKIESTRVDKKVGEVGIKGEAGGGLKLPFLKLKADFFTKMKGEAESRRIVRDEYRPRLKELIELVKDLTADVKCNLTEKEPLLIIDGLDRVSVKPAEKLFAEDGQNFAMIDNASMLLTVPISLIHSVKSPVAESSIGKMHVLKNIRLLTQDKKRDRETEKNWEIMKQAVLKRLEPRLISEKALEMAVYYSGGVFRTLIELIVFAALESEVLKGTAIGERDMEEAVKEFRIKKARPLSRSHWEILLEIDEQKKFIGEMDETRLELLAGLFALEYINGDEWYSVNPLLESRLDEYRELFGTGKKVIIKK
ncbi:MAG: hypothetical protein GTO45_32130 [Candidatus Aminicenantes bacterium]|nr:hypothetical protein [Candidatus Aminicenantes bacterium]NIM83398.1 hypothetical protein [Candidatus Aminicenantes bacterium]NIN22790.1 hypothetical protein [Candidatus Aminicenantes bacterium]NIN46524.1 hypothetical protein [Candidatus Aminicenantes bacterium]NIN89429.1 hypothetical protein [Candidatus Aminicenantes bacterium]